MKQTIRFRGLSLNKDEQSAQHGELSLCGNVELHDGALRPYQIDGTLLAGGRPLKCTLTGTAGDVVISDTVTCELLYIHTTAAYTHYISIARSSLLNVAALCWSYENKTSNLLYNCQVGGIDKTVYTLDSGTTWLDAIDDSEVTPDATPESREPEEYLTTWVTDKIANFDASDIRDIKSVGNTLCIMCGDGLHYILCKNDSGWGYKYLGQQPPFLELQFSLNYVDHGGQVTADNHARTAIETGGVGNGDVPEGVRTHVTESVMALVNKRIDKITGEGLFYAPFLVRYCYRLFDRSMVMHSSPVFLFPCLKHPVMTFGEHLSDSQGHPTSGVNVVGVAVFVLACSLKVRRLDASVDSLKEWSDIVKSVDIFITPQFSRINTSEQIKTFSKNYEDNIPSIIDGSEFDVANEYDTTYSYGIVDPVHYGFDLPEYTETEHLDRIKNASAFFRLASFSIETIDTDITTLFAELKFDVTSLKHIELQEQMTDDYKTHNILMPASEEYGCLYVYNHRLNVCGISEKLFRGFSPLTMFPYAASGATGMVDVTSVVVWVNTYTGLRKLILNAPTGSSWTIPAWYMNEGYCFYPDDRAIFMAFRHDTVSEFGLWYFRKLTPASALNGSLSFMDEGDLIDPPDYLDDASTDRVIPLTNKVYTSRADNPFYFPNLPGESGINSVGTGNIIGIAAVTRPLVQGEVGRQNLVVFATDGIWVLEVSPTGTYQSMRNLSREVCVNKESICQMDQSILFATNRSLSRFVESDVVSLSEILDGPIFDVDAKMHAFYTYLGTAGVQALAAFRTPPLDFFREGRELYDYTGSRVLVFPESLADGGVALMYSIRDGAWSTIVFPPLNTVVNSYPSPYIEKADGAVLRMDRAYDYYGSTQQHFTPGVIVTRTLTFSDTMDVVRGFRQYCDSQVKPMMFFYGSNDQRSWVYIGRSNREFSNYMPGHPYRFFRVAMVLQMYPSEEYQQLELEIINKYAKL